MIARDTDVETSMFYEPHGDTGPFYPGTASTYQRVYDKANITVSDVRGREAEYTLDHHGFEFHNHKSSEKAFDNEERVKSVVYDEVIELLKQKAGATRVHPFSHIIRRQTWQKASEVAQGANPTDSVGFIATARYCHVDQSYNGAPEVLRDNLPADFEKLSKTRWGIINVWRPIEPIRREPFGVSDASTISDDDLVERRANLPKKDKGSFENVSKGTGFGIWAAHYNPNHRWYYQSNMTPEEIMFVKCFDSKLDGTARRCLHGAFEDPKTKDDPRPRQSIEVRCLVFWEDQAVE